MKTETATLLKKHLEAGKFEFDKVEAGLAFNYELSDEEVKEIVEAEYGPSIVGDVEELFKAIVKKLVKLGVDHGSKENG